MKFSIRNFLIILFSGLFFLSCIYSVIGYDTFSINVSDVAKDRIENTYNMKRNVIYTGSDAETLLDIVSENALSYEEHIYHKRISYYEVLEDLENLNLPSRLLDDAEYGMTGYYYLTVDNEYRAYFVEAITETESQTIYILVD